MTPPDLTPEVRDITRRVRALLVGQSVLDTVEVCAQILVSALLHCDLDGRREILASLGPALANTLLQPEPKVPSGRLN